jgi:pimeloyl-ACP methyl ester carboxylesterase
MWRRILLIGTVVVLAVAIIGFVVIDRALYGIPGFHLARTFGSQFRGAHRAGVNGISLYYEIYGHGPPVLVLHGAGAFLESMHYFIGALAPGHTVIAVDSRSQGRSTDSSAPLSYAAMGSDMIALMDTLHLKQADVVGWSDGGIVGLDMAMKHPGRVRRLVAIGANYDTAGLDAKQMTPAMLDAQTREIEPLYDLIAPDPSHFPVLVKKIETMIATEPHYTLADLGRIRARVLVVAGEHDLILRRHTDAMAKAIPGAKEIIVPGASHIGPLEQPDAYNRIVLGFLDAR